MENFGFLIDGFSVLFTLQNLGATLLGCVLGLIIGAMPGIGSLAGCALLLPLTYKFNPTTAIIMLGGLYYSNMYGGAFSAILLNIPGDSPAIMTTLDGYPMATVKKRPGQALLTSNIASFIGGFIGMVVLTLHGPGPRERRPQIRSRRDDDPAPRGDDLHRLARGREPREGRAPHHVRHPRGQRGHGHPDRQPRATISAAFISSAAYPSRPSSSGSSVSPRSSSSWRSGTSPRKWSRTSSPSAGAWSRSTT